jgi:hypothetical protein
MRLFSTKPTDPESGINNPIKCITKLNTISIINWI